MPIAAGDGSPAIELDPATPIGMVRLLITDVDVDNLLFTDGQIAAFLAAEGGSRKLAAALALGAIAMSEALMSKKFSSQDLSVDGPAVAAILLKQADRLRDEAATKPDIEDPDPYGIEVAPLWNFDPPPPWANSYL